MRSSTHTQKGLKLRLPMVNPGFVSEFGMTVSVSLYQSAGGMAVNGPTRIMDLQPAHIHERTPFIVGSKNEVVALQKMLSEAE